VLVLLLTYLRIISDQFRAALQWVKEARRYQHHSVVHAYSTSLNHLDCCVTMAPTASSRQKFLASTGVVPRSLASDAASSTIETGQVETAVELLERGRTILWSKMQGYRQPLEELRDKDRKLADRFEDVCRELERHAMSSDAEFAALPHDHDGPPISYDTRIQRHRICSEEWDALVKRIQKIGGLENFLRAVPFDTLQSAAKEGPVDGALDGLGWKWARS
jgi:hypothetical protein